MSVKIVTDSTAYIDAKNLRDFDIQVLPLYVNFTNESFKETEVTNEYFYHKIAAEDTIPVSSQPSQEEIYHTFRSLIADGHEVLGIFISSILSGTYQSALAVRERLLQEYPEARIEILDSLNTAMALGLTVLEAAQAAASGKSMSEVADIARQMINSVHFYFCPDTLEYLKKGGRIGGASALLGSILKIKPILFINNGRVDVYKRCRGSKNVQKCFLELLENSSDHSRLKYVVVHHVNAASQAEELAAAIKEQFAITPPLSPIGPVIGTHVGPGAIGIVFCAM